MTVDAGHFQLECELGSWTRNGDEASFSLGEFNLKAGLDAVTDLQLVLPVYTRVRGGAEGFGDIQLRLKRNLWGNDEGETAMALMPYLKLPTANGELGNDEFEGGLIVPFGFKGPAGWSCAVMGEVDVLADEDGGGHHASFLTSATAAHALTENTACFLELVSILSTGSDTDPEAYFNTGITWALEPQSQFDFGIRAGLTDAAEDITLFTGFSTKL